MEQEKGTGGIHGRRTASRATKARRRRQRMNFLLLAVFAAAVGLIVLITPKRSASQGCLYDRHGGRNGG